MPQTVLEVDLPPTFGSALTIPHRPYREPSLLRAEAADGGRENRPPRVTYPHCHAMQSLATVSNHLSKGAG